MSAREQQKLREIILDIGAFERKCNRAGYTDSGDAWELLYAVREHARAAIVKPTRRPGKR